jgi:hypothetical protein
MFDHASNFNQSLNNWTVNSVKNVRNMFSGATKFNQPLNSWNMISVDDMTSMFNGASKFNQDLCSWYDVSYSIIPVNLSHMFYHTGCADPRDPEFPIKKTFCSACIEVRVKLFVALLGVVC